MAQPPVTQNIFDGSKDPLILKLHEDLVWTIFLFNADLDDTIDLDAVQSLTAPRGQDPSFSTNGLTVTRRTSQVCRSWRSLILSSTAIWGRVIDLEILRCPSEIWSHEVLKRTGEAPLDIKGKIMGSSNHAFFTLLVQNHWARIRRFDIGVFGVEWIRKEAWGFLKQPAPNMKVFSICFYDLYPDKPNFFSETDIGLFADRAPFLRELLISHITFDPHVSWLATLRTLDLASPFHIHQLFEVLKNTPALENLALRGEILDNQPSGGENSQIILPHLRSVTIYHRVRTCLAVLECIVPASDCGVTVHARDIPPDIPLSSAEISRFRSSVSRLSKAYFLAWKPTHVYFHISAHAFSFGGHP